MPSAKTLALGVTGLIAIGLGALALVYGIGPGWERAPPPSATGPTKTSPHTTVSVVRFSSPNTPDNCADVTFWDSRYIDFKHLEERGFVALKSSCVKSFKKYPALATCTRMDKDAQGNPTLDAVAYYYDLATIEGDGTYSGQCLGSGGAWVVKPQNDPDYARARARVPPGAKPHHEIDSLMEIAP